MDGRWGIYMLCYTVVMMKSRSQLLPAHVWAPLDLLRDAITSFPVPAELRVANFTCFGVLLGESPRPKEKEDVVFGDRRLERVSLFSDSGIGCTGGARGTSFLINGRVPPSSRCLALDDLVSRELDFNSCVIFRVLEGGAVAEATARASDQRLISKVMRLTIGKTGHLDKPGPAICSNKDFGVVSKIVSLGIKAK